MVDGLGETELVDAGLQTTLQEVLGAEGQDVIELHAGLVEHTDTDQTANQGIAFEETLRVPVVEREELTVSPLVSFRSELDSNVFHGHTEQHDGSWTG